MAREYDGPKHYHGGQTEGGALVRELPGALGLLLSAALRDISFRLETGIPAPGGVESRVFAIRAHVGEHEVAPALEKLAHLAAGESDGLEQEGTVEACAEIARWARTSGARSAHRAFALLAARTKPADAELALEAARVARDTGDHVSAELWFRHVIRLSRRRADWTNYTWAYIGQAVLYLRAGNTRAAEILLHRARRVAVRHSLNNEAGSVHHHLFTITAEGKRLPEAYAHAAAAIDYYGKGHDRLRHLAHDIGRFWLTIGEFARALQVLERVMPLLEHEVDQRTLCRANLAWAAAGAGERELQRAYEAATIAALRLNPRVEIAADAHLLLGYSWELLGDYDAAMRSAALAREISDSAAAVFVREPAEVLLERLRTRRPLQQHAAVSRFETPPVFERGQELARRLVSLWPAVSPAA